MKETCQFISSEGMAHSVPRTFAFV